MIGCQAQGVSPPTQPETDGDDSQYECVLTCQPVVLIPHSESGAAKTAHRARISSTTLPGASIWGVAPEPRM